MEVEKACCPPRPPPQRGGAPPACLPRLLIHRSPLPGLTAEASGGPWPDTTSFYHQGGAALTVYR